MYTIPYEEIERLTTTSDEKDMAKEIRVGDFVTLPRHAAGWRDAHVEWTSQNGFTVSYGSKDLSKNFRFNGVFPQQFTAGQVGEVWRQRRVAKTEQYTVDGQTRTVRSSEYEWYLVWKNDNFQQTVNWWAD